MNIKHIVVATDLSKASDPAVALAVSFGRTLGASITVVNVDEVSAFDLPEGPQLERTLKEIKERRRAGLEAYREKLEKAGLEVKVRTVVGQPVEKILNTVAGTGADLLIVGRRGVRRLLGQRLGKNTRRLLRRTKVPMLVVPVPEPDEPPRPHRVRQRPIIASTKLTPYCRMALRAACLLAVRFNARVEYLHVLRLPSSFAIPRAEWPAMFPGDTSASIAHTLDKDLEEVVGGDLAAVCSPTTTIGTSVAESVAEVAEQSSAGLIVLPARTRRSATFGALGSTTGDILRTSPVPVLVLPVEYLELNHARKTDLEALED